MAHSCISCGPGSTNTVYRKKESLCADCLIRIIQEYSHRFSLEMKAFEREMEREAKCLRLKAE